MAIEKKYFQIGPLALAADGGEDGLVTLENVQCFKVKQKVVLSSDTQEDLQFEVTRVVSMTQLYVGPRFDKKKRDITNLNVRSDISNYLAADNATIRASEQEKNYLTTEDTWKAIYEFEPTMALRNILVDKVGDPFTNENPFWVGLTDGTNNVVINEDGSINVNVVDSITGTSVIFTDPNGEFTDTSETEVSTYIADKDNTRITKFLGEAKTFGLWRIYEGTINELNLKAAIRTSPFERTAKYDFEIPQVLDNTNQLIVTFTAGRYRDNLLGGTASTFVRLEGSK